MKTKIAQGYNPDRVTVEELGKGYRLVPRRYLDRSKYDLADMAQAWTGSEWVSDLVWADEDDSHRTLLSNAQLRRMRKKRVDVEAPPLSIAAEPVVWREVTEAEILVLRGHREKVDVEKFRHFGGRTSGYFTCPADHYTTTMTEAEILDLKWRDITDAERKALRALNGTTRSLYGSRRFRHNATPSGDWYLGGCVFAPGPELLGYQTDLSPAELAKLVEPPTNPWRPVTEDERVELEQWAARPGFDRSAFDWTKFRLGGSDIHTGLSFAYSNAEYTTTLTPDELAKLVEPPVVWREITEDERVKLRSARKADSATFAASVDWGKFKFDGIFYPGLDFTDPANHYTTSLLPAELAKLVEPPKVWRPLSLAEVRIMQEVAKPKGNYRSDRFRCKLYGLRPHQFKTWDFGSSATDYETTHTEQEIVNLL